ncbi:uncharacterized protein C14orf119 isoform X2 [Danaus plexippus]|uniref:Uncharacterized protein n=2 Tax=Danaus plexippus TaxID=13037 RepID=A0A212EQZ5_DANPL|nr:uncharacterized protein C14orf119 isoform X2 [Danaus plexippus]OWR43918.1 hypothetical protein KGM_204208 [Danaus plexippus plexippus]
MSNSGLTSEAQLRYILEWFREFSELQREDFLPILAAAHLDKAEQLAASVASLSCEDKPVSLFQCRIKLFNSWFPNWSDEEKDRLVRAVSEIDSDFGTKLQETMANGFQLNGDTEEKFFQTTAPEAEEKIIENEQSEIKIASETVNVEIAAAS